MHDITKRTILKYDCFIPQIKKNLRVRILKENREIWLFDIVCRKRFAAQLPVHVVNYALHQSISVGNWWSFKFKLTHAESHFSVQLQRGRQVTNDARDKHQVLAYSQNTFCYLHSPRECNQFKFNKNLIHDISENNLTGISIYKCVQRFY